MKHYTSSTINQAFNDFLLLEPYDQKILCHYQDALMDGGESFTEVFYTYLTASPVTANVLEQYQSQGGLIDDLVKKQLQHLFGLLSGRIDDASAQRIAHVGKLHHHYGIEPVWIMGAYKLYLDYLQSHIRSGTVIKDCDRRPLENAATKLLFRDMGLMLEGYWDTSLLALVNEKNRVAGLQDQITSLLENIPQLLWSVDVINNQPLYVSPNSREICNMDIDLPIPCLAWTIPEDRAKVEAAWKNALLGQGVEIESRVRQPNGEQRWFRRLFYPAKDSAGRVVRIDGLMEDTTEAKATMERLNILATTDSLTGLTNRTLFYDRFSQAVVAASRDGDHQIVMILMDLDHFKEINDTLGHPAGDKVLISVTQRLSGLLRESDTLARLGGDEFGILLPHVSDGRESAELMANKIQRGLIKPFLCDHNELFLGASIGIAIYPEHGDNVAALMSRADVAMYSSKNTESGFMFYDTKLDPHAQQHLQLSADLRYALERNELLLHYQPKIDLRTNAVMGAEALLRWHHPVHGLVLPDEFIPLAERTGIISPITDWVIETAMKQSKRWRDQGIELPIAVNMSARVFQNSCLINKISSILDSHEISANFLELEITENLLMSDITNISHMLQEISALGVTISIDDFGTGYSSLAYLKTLPLQTLKIDRSFVMDMVSDENDAAIVRSTIDLAHNLGLNVVAEGIENCETLSLLMDLGCDSAQGYHFSRPQSHDIFLDWLQRKAPSPLSS